MAKKKVEAVPDSKPKRTPGDYYNQKIQEDLNRLSKNISKLQASISNHNDELKVKEQDLEDLKKEHAELLALQKHIV